MDQCIEDILIATDYYRVLGVSDTSSTNDIRRAYIQKSRYCHPDKCAPAHPRATECFQLLNAAYHTLTDASLRFEYDCARNSAVDKEEWEYKGDLFERLVHQACEEMMDGQFQTLRVLFYTFRGTDRCTRMDDHIIDSIEFVLRNMYSVLTHTQSCYNAVKSDLIELLRLQKQLRSLSFFDVGGRLRLSVSISKIMVKLMLKSVQKDDHTLRRLVEMLESIECKI
ncbi:DnaJ domain-containing protein [Fennellomyces sp. T-0311]|nr:DnaJ domain-containing protein [Fennellomyces sp. T-0311]